METFPSAKRQATFDPIAFAAAKARAQGMVDILQAQIETSRRDYSRVSRGEEEADYLRSVIELSEIEIQQGHNIPEKKEKLHLYLSDGGNSPTARQYARLHLHTALEDSDRPNRDHGAFLSSISRASDVKALWDTSGKGQQTSKTALAADLPADLAMAVSAANELLMHTLPRVAEQLSGEYDVQLEVPVFVQTNPSYGASTLSLGASELSFEMWDKVEAAFEALIGQEKRLHALANDPQLVQWVVVAVDDKWEQSDWMAAIEKAGLAEDPVFQDGWATIELINQVHSVDKGRYRVSTWGTRAAEDSTIRAGQNWSTPNELVSNLVGLRTGWYNAHHLGTSKGPATWPNEIVNATVAMGLARVQANKLGLTLSDSELFAIGLAPLKVDEKGDARLMLESDRNAISNMARPIVAMINKHKGTGEKPVVYPAGKDESIYSNKGYDNEKGIARYAHLIRGTFGSSGAQTAQRAFANHIKNGDIPIAPENGVLPLDHPVWTLLAAKNHTEYSSRALKNLADGGCVNTHCTTPKGTPLLSFAIAHGGADSVKAAMKLGFQANGALREAVKAGNTGAVGYLLGEGWLRASNAKEKATVLHLAEEMGGAVFAKCVLAAVRDDFMPASKKMARSSR